MYEHSHSIDSGRRMDSGGVFMRPCRGPGEGHPKTEKPGKIPHGAKTTAIAPEEKALREWRNF